MRILKERAREGDATGTSAEGGGLRAELQEAVQQMLTANEELRASARTLKTELAVT